MSAAKSKRWGCQFCGLGAEQDEKPVPGACAEREGAAHSWMNATILEGDPDVLTELQRKVAAREELVAATVGEAFGEKLRDTDVSEAQALVRRLQVEGDGLQTALLEVAKRGAAEAGTRSVLDRMCWRCGWPQPIAGGTCLAGVGWHHEAGDARSWWTPEEYAEKKDDLQRHRDILAHQIGEANLEAGLKMLVDGKSWDAVRAALPKPEPAAEEPAAVVEGVGEPAESSSREVNTVDVSSLTPDDDPPPLATDDDPPPPAKRPRGRPRKDASAATVVAAPPAPRPSPARSAEPAPEPSRIGAAEPARGRVVLSEAEDIRGEGHDPDELWLARDYVRRLLALIADVREVQEGGAGERNGQLFGEFTDELDRRLGLWTRRVLELEAIERKTRPARLAKAAAE